MGEFKDGDVQLQVSWEPGDKYLSGTYTLTNSGEARVVVFDVLYHTARNGLRSVDPEHAWRWLTPDGEYVVVKQVPAVPEGVLVEMPEIPYARLLEPKSSVAGKVMLPLPLDYQWPYPVSARPAPEGTKVRSIELVIGFAVVDASIRARPTGAADHGHWAVGFEWAKPRQKLLRSGQFAVDLPIREPGLTNP